MKKQIFKIIAAKTMDLMNSEYVGYEMGCLISSEFTPAPDYSAAAEKCQEMCEKYGYTIQEFMEWVDYQVNHYRHPYQSHPYICIAIIEEFYTIH